MPHPRVESALEGNPPRVYFDNMNIRLSPDQQAWLEAQVAAGHFSSVDDAVALAVSDLMGIGDDDLAWAKPYVEEGRAAAARGEVISLDDAVADMDSHIAALKR
jgi:antitoxin ParD1/3/4